MIHIIMWKSFRFFFCIFMHFQQFTLGLNSLSKLGLFGAGLEIILILYLGANSLLGFYSMPFMHHVRPKLRHTSLPQLILNCALLLTLSSALPLLSRIIGKPLSQISFLYMRMLCYSLTYLRFFFD